MKVIDERLVDVIADLTAECIHAENFGNYVDISPTGIRRALNEIERLNNVMTHKDREIERLRKRESSARVCGCVGEKPEGGMGGALACPKCNGTGIVYDD